MSVLCVLPARIASERLPRKPLSRIAGRTLVEWCWRAADRVPSFDEIVVATDSDEIAETVRGFGGSAVLTSSDHPSGTDRVAEAARMSGAREHDVVVNFQADEPFMDPGAVDRATRVVVEGDCEIATLAAPLTGREAWTSESVCKVVVREDGRALYFSRAAIPRPRGAEPEFTASTGTAYLRHIGLYVYGREALERWTRRPPSRLESIEKLEQLRALEAGEAIQVIVGPPTEPGVDVPADLERVERALEREGPTMRGERHV